MLNEQELQLRSGDGTELFVRRVRPEGDVRARLWCVHGFAEHGGRYLTTLRWFAERGIECAILDLRGHGRSGGRRTYVRRFNEYLDDLQVFARHMGDLAQEEGGDHPAFMLGHSMGGLVLARTLQDRLAALPKLTGAVLMSPFLAVAAELPTWKVVAGKVMSRIYPWLALPADLDPSHLSKDARVGEAYMADPLVVKTASARWYTETIAAHGLAAAQAAAITLPTLVMHGDDDHLAEPEATKRLFASLGSADKELVMWPGARHELFNEVEQLDVRERVLTWLEAHFPA